MRRRLIIDRSLKNETRGIAKPSARPKKSQFLRRGGDEKYVGEPRKVDEVHEAFAVAGGVDNAHGDALRDLRVDEGELHGRTEELGVVESLERVAVLGDVGHITEKAVPALDDAVVLRDEDAARPRMRGRSCGRLKCPRRRRRTWGRGCR